MRRHTLYISRLTRGVALALSLGVSLPALADEPEALKRATELSREGEVEQSVEFAFRYRVQREAAIAYGAQIGYATRSEEVAKILDDAQATLDRVFNFQPLVIDGKVIPPVITRGDGVFAQDQRRRARTTDVVYRIVAPARISSAPPHWRQYLYPVLATPRTPPRALLPLDSHERDRWADWVRQGYGLGVRQADEVFDDGLARLRRDYAGMIRFKALVALGIVASPTLASGSRGVVIDGDEMRIDDVVWRITDDARFAASDRWRVLLWGG